MASKIKVDQIEGSTGSTITVPTGQTLTLTDGLAVSSLPVVTVAKGGTNLSSFTAGDLLYATGSTTLAKLNKGTAEQVLAMNSGATAPDWGSVDLTVLPTISVAKGGTSFASFTAGDILYATGTTTLAKLAKGTASQTLKMNSGATAPEWTTVAAASSDFVKLHSVTTGSDVASLSIDGYFDAAYKTYKIYCVSQLGGTQSSDSQIQMRFNTGGSANTGSNYCWILQEGYITGASSTANTQRNGRDEDSFSQFQGTWNLQDAVFDQSATEVTLYDPQNTSNGKMIKWQHSYSENSGGNGGTQVTTEGSGQFQDTTACTGVTFKRANSNLLTGTFTLYGIK